jgi:hypothetical protein
MSENMDFQILFYTQCVVIVTIRLHIAFRVLSSNHSLGTATIEMAKEDGHIRAIFLSYVLQKMLLQQVFFRDMLLCIFSWS